METPRLVIGGQDVRLPEGAKVAATIAVDTLEGSEINASYTNTFAVPLSAHNKRILGAINSQDAKGYEYNPPRADLYGADGSLMLSRGLVIVNRTERDVAAVSLIDGTGTLFDLLGTATLQMFDPESCGTPHLRNEANEVANIANDYTDGFTYTPIDYGDEATTVFNVDRLWPAVYFYRLLKLVIEKAGYTLNEADGLPTSGEFRRVVMPYTGTRHNLQNYFDSGSLFISGGLPVDGEWHTYDLGGAGRYPNLDFQDGVYTVSDSRRAMIFSATPSLNLQYGEADVAIDQTVEAEARIYNRTQDVVYDFVAYSEYFSGPADPEPSATGRSFYLVSDPIFDLEIGDEIVVQLRVIEAISANDNPAHFTNTDGYPIPTGFVDWYNYYTQPIAVAVGIVPARPIYPALLLPDMLCRDWLKAVLTMFLCRLDIDEVTKVVTVRFMDSYANRTPEDWTAKIDTDGQCTQEFKFGRWGQTNTFQYAQEEGTQGGVLGNGLFKLRNEQLPSEYKVSTLPFAGSVDSSEGVPLLDILSPIATGNPIQRILKPRVLLVNSISGAIDIGSTAVTTFNQATFAGLDWPTLIATYWGELVNAVSQMQRVIIDMRVTAADIEMLDLFTPKYLFYNDGRTTFAGIYLLTKVDEYTGNGRARCEFVNLNKNL